MKLFIVSRHKDVSDKVTQLIQVVTQAAAKIKCSSIHFVQKGLEIENTILHVN